MGHIRNGFARATLSGEQTRLTPVLPTNLDKDRFRFEIIDYLNIPGSRSQLIQHVTCGVDKLNDEMPLGFVVSNNDSAEDEIKFRKLVRTGWNGTDCCLRVATGQSEF